MKFQNIDEVGHPVGDVLTLLRDKMPEINPYLPDVEEITVVEREEQEDGKIRYVNLWRGSINKVPRAVQKFITPDVLTWTDYALWHPDPPQRAEWSLRPKVGSSLFECDGWTTIEESGPSKTTIKVEGDLRVYPERMPGIPRLLAGTLRSTIEGFIIKLIVPNMQTLARGVQAYYDDRSDESPALEP